MTCSYFFRPTTSLYLNTVTCGEIIKTCKTPGSMVGGKNENIEIIKNINGINLFLFFLQAKFVIDILGSMV